MADIGIEAPDPIGSEQQFQQSEKSARAGSPPGYTGPEQRCATCSSFDGEETCSRYGATVVSDGHCKGWSGGGETEDVDADIEDIEEEPE